MRHLLGVIFILYFYGCVTLPQLAKIEYSGPKLKVSNDYKIEQMSNLSETIFSITSPVNENILFNIYKVDETLVGTLYQGPGGIILISLAITASKYDFDMPPGDYYLVLYGEKGKAGFKLKVQ